MRRRGAALIESSAILSAMAEPSEHHATEAKRNPLIPVGLTVLVIPLCIYSFGPEGPIKKSHVVFSTGQHRAHFADETLYDEYRGTVSSKLVTSCWLWKVQRLVRMGPISPKHLGRGNGSSLPVHRNHT